MLKFFDGQTDRRTHGRTDRVITIGQPPSGGALISLSVLLKQLYDFLKPEFYPKSPNCELCLEPLGNQNPFKK